MKYGVNIGPAGNLIGIIKEYKSSRNPQGFYEFHSKEGKRIVSAHNVSLASFIPVVEGEYAKALTEMRAIIKETRTPEAEKKKDIYIPGTRAFMPKSKYTIVSGNITFSGYSERTPGELCPFLMDAKGVRDIIVMTRKGQPCLVVPPAMTEGCLIEISEISNMSLARR